MKKNIKEKVLFEALSGEGKTFTSMNLAKIYAIAGKRVLYIDPDAGTDKQKELIWDGLSDEELDRIDLRTATNIEKYLQYVKGWEEEKQVGSQTITIRHFIDDIDLKVCDGLTTGIEQYKTKLTEKFIKQGFYTIGETRFTISNPDTFILPFNFYGKLYDSVKESLVIMLDHKYDIICTMHNLKDTEGQKDLEQKIYQKFDSIVKLNKLILPSGNPKWSGTILKNRGRERPDQSNILESTEALYKYFIHKFGLPLEDTLERLKYY